MVNIDTVVACIGGWGVVLEEEGEGLEHGAAAGVTTEEGAGLVEMAEGGYGRVQIIVAR